jgi:hypothetical protein
MCLRTATFQTSPHTQSMKEHPILFKGEMVRAILKGTKTQTRRIVKFPENGALIYNPSDCRSDGPNQLCTGQYLSVAFRHRDEPDDGCRERLYPKWEVGDRLWVKETWNLKRHEWSEKHRQTRLIGSYLADNSEFDIYLSQDESWLFNRWTRKRGNFTSLFMFRSLSRLNPTITRVGVEQLQDISEENAIAEGIERQRMGWMDYSLSGGNFAPIPSYASLWDSINGKGSWKLNPWVWVIEFKKL